jgi:molybdate transport system substrate-binding protein
MAARFLLTLLLAFAACLAPARAADAPLTVFAAASLKESMDEAALVFRRETGQQVRVSYAGSSALARQIERGAPADVFVSADVDWMDVLQSQGLIDAHTRSALLGNTLVLVAPKHSAAHAITLDQSADLLPLLGERGRIALALVDSVPAGRYAKAAFDSLGMWDDLRSRTAEAENVRAALLLVARGETPLGVVYGSDARAEPRVKVLGTFPEPAHPPIVYPVAKVKSSTHPQAAVFVRWLRTPQAMRIFRERGFSVR